MKVSTEGPNYGANSFVQYAKYMTKNDKSLSVAKKAIERVRQL